MLLESVFGLDRS